MKNIQTLFGVTKQELIAVLFIVSGLIIGLCIKTFFRNEHEYSSHDEFAKEIYYQLDSIAAVQQTTYTGVNENDDAYDTVLYDKTNERKTEAIKITIPSIVNINEATKAELMKLPGIGEKTAEKIIEYRKLNGFKQVSDIMNVKGIGQKKYEKLKQYITLRNNQ